MPRIFIKVFVPGPFTEPLTYQCEQQVSPGTRVRVPLGSREVIGLTRGVAESIADIETIKSVLEILDSKPLISDEIFALVEFASSYYHTPPGDLALLALPASLRKGKPYAVAKCEEGLGQAPNYALHPEQLQAIGVIDDAAQGFQCFLLQGVTGSGKTQVFSELIAKTVSRGQQVLLLVPEIGLTGQMVTRIQHQLNGRLVVSHSNLADGARARAFAAASEGLADVLIGTRSALFTPMPNLGLILIDEEHDSAYKNQEGALYSARDLAIVRAQHRNIPIVLSSATPSMETWHAANHGRYRRLRLSTRPGAQQNTDLELIDARRDRPKDGLTQAARLAITRALERKQQALIFLNRRGYAPVLMCTHCGWTPECKHCDAKPTLHRQPDLLWCHHCDHRSRPPAVCPACSGLQLMAVGQGTERLTEAVETLFPDTPVVRIDRDTTSKKKAFETLLAPVIAGEPCILVGTQMLAKGHDFKKLSTVVVTDGDQGLLGADFRAIEHFAQLLTQVAGRAGRHNTTGRVLIQTHRPDSPWFELILGHDYDRLASAIARERELFEWPPLSHLALINARGPDAKLVLQALDDIAHQLRSLDSPLKILGPAPAPMERRNRQYHAQLLLRGPRSLLHWALDETGPWGYRRRGKVMFQLDVDPWDLW